MRIFKTIKVSLVFMAKYQKPDIQKLSAFFKHVRHFLKHVRQIFKQVRQIFKHVRLIFKQVRHSFKHVKMFKKWRTSKSLKIGGQKVFKKRGHVKKLVKPLLHAY